MPWTIVSTSPFAKGYRKKTPELKTKIDECITKLVTSQDPRTLGRAKYGALQGCYGHDVDFSNRILYNVDPIKREIYFLRVCNHQEVYGKS